MVSAYAEALTLANGNRVPAAARLVFEQVLARAPMDPRARYYLALARAQAKDFEGALQAWLFLLADSQPDAPWTALVRRDIANMARFLERDLATLLPDASAQERALTSARSISPAGELSDADEDWQTAIGAARARAASGDSDGAREALLAASKRFAGAPFVQARLQEAAVDIGVALDLSAGPSADQVAAARRMSASEREEMVQGMVNRLATRLRSQPSDVNGWMMLIRSYAVLQRREQAEQAARDAVAALQSRPQAQEILRFAAQLGLVIN